MNSIAVQFRLSFASASRRQLQASTTIDTTSAAFTTQLAAALVDTLPTGLSSSNLLIASTNAAANEVSVTIVGLSSLPQMSITSIIDRVDEPSFLTAIGTDLGASVALEQPAAVIVRLTPQPAPPPPGTPPGTPPPDASTLVDASGQSLSSGQLEVTSHAVGLSTEMLWVIILSTIAFLVCVGCACAYLLGKRAERAKVEMVQIGRPALRRTPNSSHNNDRADDPDPGNPPPSLISTSAALIELGMSLERQRSEGGAARI